MDFRETNHSLTVTSSQQVASRNVDMDGEGFFVTLPSNSLTSVYPDNTIANFRTKLPQPFQCSVPYEVGLIEIQYPKTWTNFPPKDAKFKVFDKKTNKKVWLTVPTGFYSTMHQIISEINKCLTLGGMEHVRLQYNVIINRVSVLPVSAVELTFQGKLAQMLGFTPGEVFKTVEEDVLTDEETPSEFYTAPHPADVEVGMYNIFVYTDLIEYQSVGDSYVPLLRIVHITGANNRMMTRTYDRPHYHRLRKTHIDSIEISLKSDQNQHIPFTYGKTILKLHFRPIKQRF